MADPLTEAVEAGPDDSVDDSVDRERAHHLAFRLTHDVQAGIEGTKERLGSLAARAERCGWDEVSRACLFGGVVAAWFERDGSVSVALDALIERSERDGDGAMLATGLALRSDLGFAGDADPARDREEDLARAIVLLERSEGGVLERISGHTACAIALGNRWLFELSDEQYATALEIGGREPAGTLDFILAPIMFNLAEQQVSWACMLRQVEDRAGVGERWHAWKSAAAATGVYEMAEAWQVELDALGLVLGAIAGEDTAPQAQDLLEASASAGEDSARTAAILKLAIALSHAQTGRPGRAEAADAASAALDPDVHPHLYDLALLVSATIEAETGPSAGIRYARRQLDQHWSKRLASLGAMRSRIHAERLTAERELLTRHARLDDLTGIGNRRALETFVGDLQHRGASSIAVVLFDVDAFKSVNDQHGHLVGDAVLIRIARTLEQSITTADLAVRLGGDEFVVLLADADSARASSCAATILDELGKESFESVSPGLSIRASAGVAVGAPREMVDIRAAADAALYRAKAAGGGLVVTGVIGTTGVR